MRFRRRPAQAAVRVRFAHIDGTEPGHELRPGETVTFADGDGRPLLRAEYRPDGLRVVPLCLLVGMKVEVAQALAAHLGRETNANMEGS